jgi:mannose-6-phosphate isomerase
MNRDVCSADIRLVEPRKITPTQTSTGSQFFRKHRILFVGPPPRRTPINKWHFTETPYKFTDLKSEVRNKSTRRGGQSVMKANPALTPLTFEPIFVERIWGGRRLESEFGKKLPAQKAIGESWEIVDRSEAQSIVRNGPMRGKTLHELWTQNRHEIFGDVADTPRFPLLLKLLDAHQKLSLQVHPPDWVASRLGGEPKTEFWYVVAADPGAELYLGFSDSITRDQFEKAIRDGTAADRVHKVRVKTGDAAFLPSGRLHALGAGNLLIEVQQNSDTTYRVFDWNRLDDKGKQRQLHIDQALECINFDDVAPKLVEAQGELLVRHELFEVQKWNLTAPREISSQHQFAIVCCLSGAIRCRDADLSPGGFFLVPASLSDQRLQPQRKETSLLRITIPT